MIPHPSQSAQNSELGNLVKYFLNNTLKEIMGLVHAECGSLFIFDDEHNELILNSYVNPNHLAPAELKYRIGEGICGRVANNKAPVLVKNIDKDNRFNRNGFNHYRTKSFISIPVFLADRLLGLINLTDKSSGESFSEDDLNVAVTVSKYACVVLESSCNYVGMKEEVEKLDKQKAQLEKYASVGKLAAGVVHEINNPLDGVIRYTNILLNQMEESSSSREYLLEVRKGLQRIAGITRSLLDFSYQVNSWTSKMRRYIDIHEVVEDTLNGFSGRFGSVAVLKDLRLQNPLVPDYGLCHVVTNIVKNALDAMPSGGTLTVRTTGDGNGGVQLSIADTGTGIPDDIKEKIFEPFYTTKTCDKGTGLGLAICQEVVQKYGGTIEVNSRAGKGSEFIIRLPGKDLEHE